MTTIIALSGKKQSGKNTVAKLLAKHSGLKCIEIGFADALKCEVATACGVTVEYINQNKSMFRLILQGWGTDYRRRLNSTYWLKKFLKKFMEKFNQQMIAEDFGLVLVTDVRFHNEHSLCNTMGAVMVRVERNGLPEDYHVSETALDGEEFHFRINNNSDFDHLEEECVKLLKEIKLIK